MRERPILFNGEMVRAILDGRKTQTRRVIKNPEWREEGEIEPGGICVPGSHHYELQNKCPYGKPGDRLWVRETFEPYCQGTVLYRATDSDRKNNWGGDSHKWKPSIHMKRWMSRINLEITNVREERVQDISEEDAKAEGVGINSISGTHKTDFVRLWVNIHKGKPTEWCFNPLVRVLEFKMI